MAEQGQVSYAHPGIAGPDGSLLTPEGHAAAERYVNQLSQPAFHKLVCHLHGCTPTAPRPVGFSYQRGPVTYELLEHD